MRSLIAEYLKDIGIPPLFTVFLPGSWEMICIGFLFLSILSVREFERYGVDRRAGINALIIAIVFSVVGGRIFYALLNLKTFLLRPSLLFTLWSGGYVLMGGLLGAGISSAIYLWRKGKDLWSFGDSVSSPFGIWLFFARIGCFLNGCDFGRITDSFLGVKFPRGSPVWFEHLREGFISIRDEWSLSVHPVQLYESLFGLFTFFLFRLKAPRFKGENGILALFLYSIFRFFNEFLRGDSGRGNIFGMSLTQALCTVLIVFNSIVYLLRRRV